MRGVYVAITILAVIASGVCSVPGYCGGADEGLRAAVPEPAGDGGPAVEAKPRIRLYVLPQPKPEPKPDPIPVPLPEPKPPAPVPVPPVPPAPQRYPELDAAEGVIVVFGAPWCSWCHKQTDALRENSRFYNVVYFDIEADPKYAALRSAWKLGDLLPVTVLVEKGKPVRIWKGYTGWNQFYPYVGKAKKTNEQRKPDFIIRPL